MNAEVAVCDRIRRHKHRVHVQQAPFVLALRTPFAERRIHLLEVEVHVWISRKGARVLARESGAHVRYVRYVGAATVVVVKVVGKARIAPAVRALEQARRRSPPRSSNHQIPLETVGTSLVAVGGRPQMPGAVSLHTIHKGVEREALVW